MAGLWVSFAMPTLALALFWVGSLIKAVPRTSKSGTPIIGAAGNMLMVGLAGMAIANLVSRALVSQGFDTAAFGAYAFVLLLEAVALVIASGSLLRAVTARRAPELREAFLSSPDFVHAVVLSRCSAIVPIGLAAYLAILAIR